MMKTVIQTFLVLIFFVSIGACNPMKVTDPAASGFDPDKFSFSDYQKPGELEDAYKKLFPPGTPKEFVDKVLIKAGGAKSGFSGSERQNIWSYRHPSNDWKGGPKDRIFFDQTNKLVNISIGGNFELYVDQPKFIQRSETNSETIDLPTGGERQ